MSDTDYDAWNSQKKELQCKAELINHFPKEGEVWMSAVGINIGYEQNGSGKNFSRPLLVIKKFNNHIFWCVPLSTKQKHYDFYYNYKDPDNQDVSAILAQMKLVSVHRLRRKMYELDIEKLNDIKLKLQSFLSLSLR